MAPIALGWRGMGVGSRVGSRWTPVLRTGDGGLLPLHWYQSVDCYQEPGRVTVCASDGDYVGSWTDLTVNADHLSQATEANKPTWENDPGDQLNGWPVLRGWGDQLAGLFTTGGAISQPYMLFVVGRYADDVDDGSIRYLTNGPTDHEVMTGKGVYLSPDRWQWGGTTGRNDGPSDTEWHIWSVIFDGASSELRFDGGAVADSGNIGIATATGLAVFAAYEYGYVWKGYAAELLLYGGRLSVVDHNQVGDYLAWRYGLDWIGVV